MNKSTRYFPKRIILLTPYDEFVIKVLWLFSRLLYYLVEWAFPCIYRRPLRMKIKKILFGAGLLALMVILGLWLRREVQIDHCLDQSGRWDETRHRCDGAMARQPVVSLRSNLEGHRQGD